MSVFVRGKGIRRTKVTRDDGHAFETLESVAIARTIYTPEDGFTSVTEVYGHDADIDGPRKPAPKDVMGPLLARLNDEELAELADMLWRGWSRADKAHPPTYTDTPLPNGGRDFQSHQNLIVWDLEKTHRPFANEIDARYLGCRWESCLVCCHSSCRYCPSCNPGEIAPNGDTYDNVKDST